MSSREQLRRIRKQLESFRGNPIEAAVGKVMDECEAAAWEPKTYMTWEELEAASKDTSELLKLLDGAKPQQDRANQTAYGAARETYQ